MKNYPVTVNFDKGQVIGELTLNDDAFIPLNFHFALEGIIKKSKREGDIHVIQEYELTGISLLSDSQFCSLERNNERYEPTAPEQKNEIEPQAKS